MELPTCPHCGQSVLDDDVEECPFCGELMSDPPTGKKKPAPSAAPAPEPAAPEQSATKTPTKRPEKKAPAAAKTSSEPDEPFAVDQVAMTKAIPLRPKPAKGRTYKVVCPMCETPGYTSPKAGGREVKCANPKCLVPIFTCPEPPPAPSEEEPEASGLSTTVLGLMSAAALLVIGAGIWFFVLKEDTPEPTIPEIGRRTANNQNPQNETPAERTQSQAQSASANQRPQGPDLGRLRQQAPEKMVAISQQTGGRLINRNKPLSVQWAAQAYARMGELQKAQSQLERLSNFSDDEPHYRVQPWVEIGWQRRQREESAAEAADKALQFAQNVPSSVQDSWNEAVSLSALLAALDRADETQPLMGRDLGDAGNQQLWLDMLAVEKDRSFNLEQAESFRSLISPANAAWSGVVWQLVFHDEADAALAWCQSAPGLNVQAEALVAWSEALVARALVEEQSADDAPLKSAMAGLPESWQSLVTARAYARMGQRYAIAEDQAQAEAMLETARSALDSFPEAEPMALPDKKELHDTRFSSMRFAHTQAAAAFEVARLQASLKKTDAAWESIEQGLTILRSQTPSPSAVAQLQAELKSRPASVRSELQDALSLNSDDDARRAYRTYQVNVNELKRRADSRLQWQADLLAKAAQWNLAEPVAQEILASLDAEDPEPYLEMDLPWVVLAQPGESRSEAVSTLDAKLKERRVRKPRGQALLENSLRWLNENKTAQLADTLGRPTDSLSDVKRRRWILRLAARPVLEDKTEQALSFTRILFNRDPFLAEDAARLTAGLGTRTGHGDTVWQELNRQSWSPTQQIAGYLGFIQAVDAPPPEPEPESETESD